MLARILSSAVVGIDALQVEVEVDVARGLPVFTTVGLPDNAVKESKDRVRSAVKNSGYTFPTGRITVNLAPAELKKEGAAFDLPVALGILSAESIVEAESLLEYIVLGELSLDGRVKAVRGALSVAVAAKKLGKKLILPKANAKEAALVEGLQVYGVDTLPEVVEFLNGREELPVTAVDTEAFFRK
ncbi:MAG: hypothetical protein KAS88_06050, partial [Deltaproteobacteria bacterium]|nr:hypothetical protein [Deltaproteobacteria bacterium]